MFGSRRRGNYSESRKFPWLFLLIFVSVVLAVTVTVGNLLPLLLGEEEIGALQGGKEEEGSPRPESTVKRIRARAYTLGASLDSVWEYPHVSVSLNAPSGRLAYVSAVSKHLGYDSYRTRAFGESMEELDDAASYISGVFYPYAPYLSSKDLCDAETQKEIALMREFLRAGGDEILLRDLPLLDEEIDLSDILSYVETVSDSLGDAPLVVAVPLSALEGKTAHRLLTRLGEVCDRLALDLGAADGSMTPEEWLTECDYYLSQYQMRLLLSESQTELLSAAEDRDDVQTFTRIPADELSRPEA